MLCFPDYTPDLGRQRYRFGKSRVPGCRCEYRFTCGPCMAAAKPWPYTPDAPSGPGEPPSGARGEAKGHQGAEQPPPLGAS